MLTFRDKKFELLGDLLKMITKKNYKVDLANLSDNKIMYNFAKKMYFDEKSLGDKNTRDKSLITLLKSPAVKAPGLSTTFSPENPHELCDRFKLLLQEKQAGINSNIFDEEIIAIAGKL